MRLREETVESGAASASSRVSGVGVGAHLHPFNWRVLLARFLVFGLAVGLTGLMLPGFVIKPVGGQEVVSVVILAAIVGLVNAFFKPLLQLLALPFMFIFGSLAVLAINTALFVLLDSVAEPLVQFSSAGWVLLSAVVVGVLAFVFENLVGLSQPIFPDFPVA